MKLEFSHVLLSTIAATLACLATFAKEPGLGVRDLHSMSRLSSPVLSADGKHLLYQLAELDASKDPAHDSEAWTRTTAIWLLDMSTGDRRRLTSLENSASDASWSADGQSVYFLSSRTDSQQLWRLPMHGGEAEQVTDFALGVETYQISADDSRLVFSTQVFADCAADFNCTSKRLKAAKDSPATGVLYKQLFVRHWDTWADGRLSQLFSVALDKSGQPAGNVTLLSNTAQGDVPGKPFGGSSDYTISPDGSQVAFALREAGSAESWSTNFDIYLVPVDGSATAKNLTATNLAWDTTPVFAPDGKSLYYLAMQRPGYEADRFSLTQVELATGTRRSYVDDWDRSAQSLSLSANGRKAYVTAWDIGNAPLFEIDLKRNTVSPLTNQGHVTAVAMQDGNLVYAMDSLAHPTRLFALKGKRSTALSEHNQAILQSRDITDYEQFSFAGWNNESVYGWVLKPAGYQEGQTYPIAFLIHGGPQGSFGNAWSNRWNPQLWAGMGYAVVMIDFHGSVGYGQQFTDSIAGDWGGKPLEDLQKGFAAAVKKFAFLDGDKSCALGGSYGGYMVNWIAGNWPEQFDCLVNHDGIFDNRMMYYATEELWFTEWEHGGPYFAASDTHERHNPVHHVTNWKAPMLVIHGTHDHRVPLEQGLATFTALQRQGIASQFLHFPTENHWVLDSANSVLWYDTVETWMNKYLQTENSTLR